MLVCGSSVMEELWRPLWENVGTVWRFPREVKTSWTCFCCMNSFGMVEHVFRKCIPKVRQITVVGRTIFQKMIWDKAFCFLHVVLSFRLFVAAVRGHLYRTNDQKNDWSQSPSKEYLWHPMRPLRHLGLFCGLSAVLWAMGVFDRCLAAYAFCKLGTCGFQRDPKRKSMLEPF